ncbi:hypothetical protein TNCV_4532481 [Trichonephila clavipes]|nr:hypothetical protein TNCV_4532481 [Trichonephila clavipes]
MGPSEFGGQALKELLERKGIQSYSSHNQGGCIYTRLYTVSGLVREEQVASLVSSTSVMLLCPSSAGSLVIPWH